MANCRKCGGLVAWRQGKGGRYYAVELDGTDHATVCSIRVRKDRQKVVDWYRELEQEAREKGGATNEGQV